MSSPLDRDFGPDEPSPYAPKWVRDAAYAHRRAAAAPKMPAAGETNEDRSAADAAAAPAADGLVIDRYRVPRSLDPTLMPEPWPVPRARSVLGVLARFAAAITVAALVALLVVVKVPASWTFGAKETKDTTPSFGSRFAGQNGRAVERPKPVAPQLSLSQEAARTAGDAFPLGVSVAGAAEGASVVVDGLAVGATVTAGQAAGAGTWRVPVSALSNALVKPPRGYSGPMDLTVELRLADGAAVDRKPLRLEWAAAAPRARSAAFRQLDRDEIADLVRRGEAFIVTGDLAAARLLLQRAAEAGDARAALTLAGTYDPIVLEKLGLMGFASDIGKARSWYERAREFGSAEAPRRLEMLASRDH
jgi:hypothetical protein